MASTNLLSYSSEGVSENQYTYRTNRRHRGTALIFNIRKFTFPYRFPERCYSDMDTALIKTPLKNLGFNVMDILADRDEQGNRASEQGIITVEYIQKVINNVAKEDHSDADCFLCVFLSYGHAGQLFASNGSFPIEKLQEPFLFDGCTLNGKPKLFLLQTCTYYSPHCNGYCSANAVPQGPDFFFFCSQIPTHKFPYNRTSLNKPMRSIFIKLLAQQLSDCIDESEEKGRPTQDFTQLCVRVTAAVAAHLERNYEGQFEKNRKALPLIMSTLTKELYMGKKNLDH